MIDMDKLKVGDHVGLATLEDENPVKREVAYIGSHLVILRRTEEIDEKTYVEEFSYTRDYFVNIFTIVIPHKTLYGNLAPVGVGRPNYVGYFYPSEEVADASRAPNAKRVTVTIEEPR